MAILASKVRMVNLDKFSLDVKVPLDDLVSKVWLDPEEFLEQRYNWDFHNKNFLQFSADLKTNNPLLLPYCRA